MTSSKTAQPRETVITGIAATRDEAYSNLRVQLPFGTDSSQYASYRMTEGDLTDGRKVVVCNYTLPEPKKDPVVRRGTGVYVTPLERLLQ